MFLSFRTPQKIISRLGLAMALLLANGPARAASRTSVFEDARDGAVEAGIAIAAYWDRIVARDIPTIQATAFSLSGLIGLIGLWLLMRQRRPGPLYPDVIYVGTGSVSESETEDSPAPEAEPDRPPRLLEAIAAAKAQVAISEAEKKHRR